MHACMHAYLKNKKTEVDDGQSMIDNGNNKNRNSKFSCMSIKMDELRKTKWRETIFQKMVKVSSHVR
jgi:hypothetical protein